jgi:hypothetical protein
VGHEGPTYRAVTDHVPTMVLPTLGATIPESPGSAGAMPLTTNDRLHSVSGNVMVRVTFGCPQLAVANSSKVGGGVSTATTRPVADSFSRRAVRVNVVVPRVLKSRVPMASTGPRFPSTDELSRLSFAPESQLRWTRSVGQTFVGVTSNRLIDVHPTVAKTAKTTDTIQDFNIFRRAPFAGQQLYGTHGQISGRRHCFCFSSRFISVIRSSVLPVASSLSDNL